MREPYYVIDSSVFQRCQGYQQHALQFAWQWWIFNDSERWRLIKKMGWQLYRTQISLHWLLGVAWISLMMNLKGTCQHCLPLSKFYSIFFIIIWLFGESEFAPNELDRWIPGTKTEQKLSTNEFRFVFNRDPPIWNPKPTSSNAKWK